MAKKEADLIEELFPNQESQKKWANNLKAIGTVVAIPTLSLALILEVEQAAGALTRSPGLNAMESSAAIVGVLGILVHFIGRGLEKPRKQTVISDTSHTSKYRGRRDNIS